MMDLTGMTGGSLADADGSSINSMIASLGQMQQIRDKKKQSQQPQKQGGNGGILGKLMGGTEAGGSGLGLMGMMM